MEEMATKTTALAAEKELKKAQTQLATAKQAEQETKEQASQMASQKEKEIAELRAALAEAKKRELNPGEFGWYTNLWKQRTSTTTQ